VPIPGGPRPQQTPVLRLEDLATFAGVPVLHGDPATPITGVTLNSRTVRPGDLYAALPGQRAHGADYLDEAVRAGAVAVLTDPTGQQRARRSGVAVLVLPDPRAALGALAARVYGDPARRLMTFGVTGTNGKTTTTYLLDAALRAQGRRTGLVGTIEIRVDTERVLSTGTTPEAPDLHALLAVMGEHEISACSMEVSSHALAQHRVDGVVFDVAGFTNLTRDHLDYHRTMEDYFAAKAALFTPEHARRAVVCVDDDWGRLLAERATIPVTTVSLDPSSAADWVVRSVRYRDGLPVVDLDGPADAVVVRCPLPGDFNVANCALAVAMLVDSGIPASTAADLVADAGAVPGRMERVIGAAADGEPTAVVDYAHSPDAVAKALAALRPLGSPLVIVLGAGGDRDREKRPLMGQAAAVGADVVIVTDDNPRSEDPSEIRAAVLAGARQGAASSGARVLQVPDRRAAVAVGVREAWGGGVLLIAGKGHEQGQEIGGTVHPFDDRTELRTALAATDVSGSDGAAVAMEDNAS
jgi:UDP-N-acetylmuramoyl-L-alanyl-D-glutamate--2,6-diaminopimelate ligase